MSRWQAARWPGATSLRLRFLLGAAREGIGAAVAQAAARRRVRGIADGARDRQLVARLVDVRPRHGLDQRLRVRVGGPRDHLARRPVLDHLAEIHHEGALADIADERQVVRDVEGREAEPLPEIAQQVEDARPDADIEHRDGLVGHQEARPEHERAREHHALQLAARQLMRQAVEMLALVLELDEAQGLADARLVLRARRRACS